MNAQQLKNSILQMAVSGKLVPQDPNNEPASVLLERIRKEKEALIKAGKIKREKNPSYIFRGSDNTPYEKIGDYEPVSIVDEIPFDIPDSWEWVRLSDLVTKEIKRGKSPTYIASSSTLVFAQKCNVKTGGIDMSLAKFLDEKTIGKYSEEEYMQDNDIVINSTGTGTMGRIGLFHDADNPSGFPIVPDSHVTIVRLNHNVSVNYLVCCLQYYQPYLEENGEGSTNQKELKPDTIKNLFIPLPPKSEQHRIAHVITAIEPYIGAYSRIDIKLSALNKEFPEQLKKSILQQAVQGKLVPQDPDDEPASVLLERFRAEKERLIAEGKIKRDKNESVIYKRDNSHYEKINGIEHCIDDEIPFDIPDSWEWVRLFSFGLFSSGKTPSMADAKNWNGTIPWVSAKDMKNPVIVDSEMHITTFATKSMQLYPKGTVLLVARSGILRRKLPLCVLGVDSTINQDIKAFQLFDPDLSEWLYYALEAYEPMILHDLVKSVTTVESLKFDEFSKMLIPLPSLQEQVKILDKVKQIFSDIEKLQ